MLLQLRQFWTGLSTAAKLIYGGVAALLLAVVAGVGVWTSRTPYSVLYSKLPPEDAAAIAQKLDADRVSYQVSNDGTTILVPTEKVPKLRMNLAAAGLPQGVGKGYELFDTMSIGATPFVQNMNYTRAIQGELARTIMTLDPVASARVHIVQPDESVFVRDEKPVTASVTIKTRPGKVLSREATAAIVHIMAGSVKGLTADNVIVTDTEGRLLSEKHDARGATSNDQLAYQRDVESNLADKAQQILTRALGPGRAVVRVTAEMSFRHVREATERFDPDGKVVQRESVMSSKMSALGGPAGATGATSNIPPSPTIGPPPPLGPNKNDETILTEYLVSRFNQEKEEQQGLIDRLTVAVILIPAKADGGDPADALGITPDDARELVKTAVGFKEGRGDKIQVTVGKAAEVEAVPPPPAAVNEASVAASPFGQDYISVVRASSLGVAGLIAIAIVFKLMRRRSSKSPSPAPSPAFAMANQNPDELTDLHAVAATIKAWLDEPSVIRFDQKFAANAPQAKPA